MRHEFSTAVKGGMITHSCNLGILLVGPIYKEQTLLSNKFRTTSLNYLPVYLEFQRQKYNTFSF